MSDRIYLYLHVKNVQLKLNAEPDILLFKADDE